MHSLYNSLYVSIHVITANHTFLKREFSYLERNLVGKLDFFNGEIGIFLRYGERERGNTRFINIRLEYSVRLVNPAYRAGFYFFLAPFFANLSFGDFFELGHFNRHRHDVRRRKSSSRGRGGSS